MEVQGKEIELPTLASNPFSTLPLEANQDHLLVGRVHVKDAMTQYIQFKSPRRILLSGEMGLWSLFIAALFVQLCSKISPYRPYIATGFGSQASSGDLRAVNRH